MKIIKITALWCSACLITNPRFNEVIKDYNDIEVIEYDYDFDSEIVSNYNIGHTIPVFIALNGDIELGRLVGEKSKNEIKEFLERVM